MAQSKWEADKMLDVYIYDYLMKRNLQATAKAFLSEGNVATDPVAIDAPGGFLFEWWSVFWDIFIARTNPKHSDVAAAFIETQQMKAREQQQQQQMQQLQLMQRQHVQMQQPLRDPGHPAATAFNGAINTMNSDPVLGSSATVLAAKLIEERMKNPSSMGSEPSPQLLESRMALLKSGVANRPGQLVQGNSVNVSTIQQMQQMQARNQQTDMKGDLSVLQRSLPVDPSLYGQNIMQAKPGLSGVGLNQGVSGLPLKGWPLTGIDQLRPNLGMQKQFVTSQSQVQLMSPRQQFLAQAQAQGLTNSGEMGPQGFRALPGGGFTGKDAQPNGNDGSIGSPVQSSSSKMNVAQMQQSSTQQPQEMQQHQQLQQQNNRKRKPTSSGPANSTGTGNHAGPSPPSTPSTHTPGDAGVAMAAAGGAGNLQQQMGVMQKNPMMYSSETMGGFASSSNQMDILDHCGDIGFFDDNVESFLSNDDADPREIFAALKRSPADNSDSLKGIALTEAGVNRISTSKVLCCHFSSDGKILASAGHDKRVNLWNMETQQIENRTEEHVNFITDIRFRMGIAQLATSSSDGTVRLWNAAERGGCIQTFMGHSSQVTSLDFHPKRTELLCSSDDNGEIRFWLVGQNSPSRVSRGGTGKVRFQPRVGRLLAAAAENTINIIDIEADMQIRPLKGHNNEVHSVCWDENGDFLASVSQDTVKVWSTASMECVHELNSNGNKFNSCVFHPRYPKILIVGGYQSLELWSVTDGQRLTMPAHDGQIAALAQSPVTGLVASASHDRTVKLWK
ncbi:Transcriptional corepressor leunig-like protein [Rhynchospora pubera]|uniref:Transcriptional corepressor leunig-like protein n=1 Tax=Rhynchospora pubera TaxID=906938 RepID=A0AAV8BX53_9POAL|nr:Transcriptional corepressor leunig-like protein [Rhynchospora pubera]KAJ4800538.1 Transcriptional corepressor leunig-like protein [Rhynchospora pubera]KAJ4812186.1 Transcriptional corepressor leunig-like protein [Rhynchospora pubera]